MRPFPQKVFSPFAFCLSSYLLSSLLNPFLYLVLSPGTKQTTYKDDSLKDKKIQHGIGVLYYP